MDRRFHVLARDEYVEASSSYAAERAPCSLYGAIILSTLAGFSTLHVAIIACVSTVQSLNSPATQQAAQHVLLC